MAENERSASAVAADAAAPSMANLRIITLAHGANRENDVLLTVPLDLTIGELKGRLTSLIPGSPGAEQQRLIYQGRPLLDNVATMRSILRFQAGEQTTHVLHLVIRTDATSIPPTNQPASMSQPAGMRPPHGQTSQPRDIPQLPHMPQMPHMPSPFPNMLNPAQMAEQANIIQQHMAIHNQHLANLQPGLPHGAFGGMPNAPGQLHPNVPATHNPFPHHNLPNMPHNTSNTPNGVTMRIQETIGPNGERTRIVTNGTGSIVHQEMNRSHGMNPVERSASAPGTAESNGGPGMAQMHQANQYPFGPGNMLPLPTQPFPIPRPRVGLPYQNLQAINNPASTNPTVWLLSSPTGPQALLFAPGHGYFSTTPSTNTAAQDTSRDVGANAESTPQQQTPQTTNTVRQPHQQQGEQQENPIANAQPGAEIVLRPQAQPQAQPAPPVAGNMIPRLHNRNGGDIAAFVVQRGWLFLQLSIFTFLLSEAGTWRRYILIFITILVCILPQENPFIDAFNNARRHLDNLIGPPDPVRQRQADARRRLRQLQGAGQPPTGGANAPGDAAARQNVMPTPEEHARRLLQQHQERNPSFIRGILRPVEQAVALFLASLIPGVGERHIRAREEARRIAAEEEERLRAEREEQANQQSTSTSADNELNANSRDAEQKNETAPTSSSLPPSTESNTESPEASTSVSASATGVEASNVSTNTSEGLRQRNGENNQPPPNLVADW